MEDNNEIISYVLRSDADNPQPPDHKYVYDVVNPVHTNNTLSPINLTNISWNNDSTYDDYYNYDYDYDYDSSVSTLPVAELVAVALVYGLTLLLGVLGNALVIFSILRYRRMQTVTNIFLTSLASADLMLVILCVPIKVRITKSN